MKPVAVLFMVALMLLTFSSCGRMGKEMQPNMENSDNPQTVETQDIGNVGDINGAEGTEKMNNYDFSVFNNVEISGIDVDSLDIEERSVLYRQAEYCQAMTDADIDKMREIVSENMTFTHMSGMQQTREEYFADIADGSLNYFTIGIAGPVIKVTGDTATITYTAVLNANAYGARGTYRMKGTHHYEKRDGAWIAVNG